MSDTQKDPRILLRSMLRNPKLREEIVEAIQGEQGRSTVVRRGDGTGIRINVLGPKAPVPLTN